MKKILAKVAVIFLVAIAAYSILFVALLNINNANAQVDSHQSSNQSFEYAFSKFGFLEGRYSSSVVAAIWGLLQI